MAAVDVGMLFFVAAPVLLLTALSVLFVSSYRDATDEPTAA